MDREKEGKIWGIWEKRDAGKSAGFVAGKGYIGAMKEAVVRARVHPDLKEDAERVFETLGINTTEAIRMFLSQVRLRGGLPFSVEIPRNEDLLMPTGVRQSALDSVYDDEAG